jgi:hypothetical protein
MPESAAWGALCQTRLDDSICHGSLNQGFVNVMPPLFARLCILPEVLLRKGPLEIDEPLGPVATGLLGAAAVIRGPQEFYDAVIEPRRRLARQ